MSQDNFTIKDLYAQYWHCRDFEIQNLWQRSIFLATFLVLCFTGYGWFSVSAFFAEKEICIKYVADSMVDLSFKHLIALAFALIGVIMSMLWIYMAKASKAWVEVYETAITAIDKCEGFLPRNCGDIGGFHMENLPNYGTKRKDNQQERQFSNSIFSCQGGTFSPSKINICIGQVSFGIWTLVGLVHFLLLLKCGCLIFICFSLAFVIPFLIWVNIPYSKKLILSRVLEEKDPGYKGK